MRRFIVVLIFSLFVFTPSSFAAPKLNLSDDDLLEAISRQTFQYFLKEHDPKTGLVRDRAYNLEEMPKAAAGSIAATGFALTAYGVAVKRNWIDYGTARNYTRRTLKFLLERAPHEQGFFYHFMQMETGERAMRSELSPIDTALLLAGVLFADEFYEDVEISRLASAIYERINWPWMLNRGKTFALAWSPETGFSQYRWDHYNESMILYLLAMGSPTHPIPADSWKAIHRPVGSYKGHRMIQMPPLFTHQYSHIWIDFRDKNDGFADYFQNSVQASLANRQFVMDQAAQFSTYGSNSWGITASDGPFGYRAYGAPPGWANHDGTIAPTGCGGSIVFTPKESMTCLRYFYESLGDKLWGRYGFSDSFNLDKDWFASDAVGIDQGALLLMIENYRSGLIWDTMNHNLHLQEAMKKVGFQSGSRDLPWPEPPTYEAPYIFGGIQVDGLMQDWPNQAPLTLNESFKESGSLDGDKDLKGEFRFSWDEQALYFFAKVIDDQIILKRSGKNIWRDDMVEIFVDPETDGLYWNHEKDFQIGFRPNDKEEAGLTWAWFQKNPQRVNMRGEDPVASGNVMAVTSVLSNGYSIEGLIRWKYLGLAPQPGQMIKVSPALHDADENGQEAKLHWFFRNEEELLRFNLGNIKLMKNTSVHEIQKN